MALVGLDENDPVGNATSFTRADGVSYPVGWDPHFAVATAYGVIALPQTFFLNAKHQIVDRIFGPVRSRACIRAWRSPPPEASGLRLLFP